MEWKEHKRANGGKGAKGETGGVSLTTTAI